MADDNDMSLGEIFSTLERYAHSDVFDQWRDQIFFRYSPQQRMETLLEWDKKMQLETKPTKDHAALLSKQRELVAMDRFLRSANR
jgi:hypothetical protein